MATCVPHDQMKRVDLEWCLLRQISKQAMVTPKI